MLGPISRNCYHGSYNPQDRNPNKDQEEVLESWNEKKDSAKVVESSDDEIEALHRTPRWRRILNKEM